MKSNPIDDIVDTTHDHYVEQQLGILKRFTTQVEIDLIEKKAVDKIQARHIVQRIDRKIRLAGAKRKMLYGGLSMGVGIVLIFIIIGWAAILFGAIQLIDGLVTSFRIKKEIDY